MQFWAGSRDAGTSRGAGSRDAGTSRGAVSQSGP